MLLLSNLYHNLYILSCCTIATLKLELCVISPIVSLGTIYCKLMKVIYQLSLTMCLSCISAWCTKLVQFYELLRVEIWSIKLVEEITLSQYYHQYVDTSVCVQICVVSFLTWLPTFRTVFCCRYVYMHHIYFYYAAYSEIWFSISQLRRWNFVCWSQ